MRTCGTWASLLIGFASVPQKDVVRSLATGLTCVPLARCFGLTRLERYQQFKNFEKRILVATDLFGRGMDIEKVFGDQEALNVVLSHAV